MALGNLGIIQRLLLGVLLLILGSLASLGGYWTYLEYRDFRKESALLRRQFIESQNRVVKTEVDKAVGFVQFTRAHLEKQLKSELKARVDQAVDMVESLYLANIADMPEEQIKRLCREVLRSVRFWDGRGYYFALNTRGIVELNTDRPHMEGANLLDVTDTQGRSVNRKFIALARKQGMGFYEYTWTKPGQKGAGFRKLSYIRYYRPLDWVIGLGEYLDDWTRAAQKEVLRGLEEVIYDKRGYLFAGTYQGLGLLGPARNRSILDTADAGGRTIVRQLIDTAKKGGGFLEYVLPGVNGERPLSKVSYCRGVPEWGWFVGAGYYLADLEESVARGQEQLKQKIRYRLINISILIFLSCCLAVLIFTLFAKGLARELGVFRSFFTSAGAEMKTMDTSALRTPELRSLGEAANRMVAERDRITREKQKVEEQLRQSQKMEAMGSLAGGIAHDFNNILAAIVGYTELAQHDIERGGKPLQELDQVLTASQRARDLVRQILTFSRKSPPALATLDMNQEVADAARMLERTIPRMIRVELHLDRDLPPVQGDRTQMEQVLMNLGSNAADAMPGGGRLLLQTDVLTKEPDGEPDIPPGRYVRLTVSDNGRGMEPETVERIFDPFFTTKPTGKGTGLGLATVYGIIGSHNGFITCQSRPDRGTTFTILLPALAAAKQGAASAPGPSGGGMDGHETVLVVDDDPMVRDVASRFLTRRGYRVISAASGEEALSLYRADGAKIDLVLLDLSMPGMGGHACLQRLLALDPEARVIIASGYSPNGEIRDTVSLGAETYVTKPFREEELLGSVRRVLDG